jgi:hypothetical protein
LIILQFLYYLKNSKTFLQTLPGKATCSVTIKVMSRIFYKFSLVAVAVWCLGFASVAHNGSTTSPDLTTPQNSYQTFINALKTSNTDLLKSVATPTGMTSLMVLAKEGDFTAGMPGLADELESSQLQWDEITEDIYFVAARVQGKVHKMEFTLEEPGWMLYHWQIGGGAGH